MILTKLVSDYIRRQWFNFRRALEPQAREELLSGANVRLYEPGTTKPRAVYADDALLIAHANPLFADSRGEFYPVFIDPQQQVSAAVYDRKGSLIYTIEDAREFCGPMTQCPHCGGPIKQEAPRAPEVQS